MAKAIFGEYGAFTVKNGVRYTKNNVMTGGANLPDEAIAILNKQLGYIQPRDRVEMPAPTPKFVRPTEEQLAKMRAESLIVPEHLQRTDFEEPTPTEEPLPLDSTGQEPLPRSDEPVSVPEVIEKPAIDTDYLETISIHTASIEDIAQALYERFGLYSIYINQFPASDEINPLTGDTFTKYHLGIAYQAAIRAVNQGIPVAEEGRRRIDAGREASAHYQERLVPVPNTMGEARRADSFEYRTSPQGTRTVPSSEVVHETDAAGVVHAIRREIAEGETGIYNGATARYDAEEDEPLVQPNFSGKPIIRPDW